MKVDSAKPERRVLDAAAEAVLRGGVIGFPTDTVYGLGCSLLDVAAVEMVGRLKRRAREHAVFLRRWWTFRASARSSFAVDPWTSPGGSASSTISRATAVDGRESRHISLHRHVVSLSVSYPVRVYRQHLSKSAGGGGAARRAGSRRGV